ncbi:MAG: hypothetical protein K9N23_08275 [Akkermansiaceae bacterium]|nr:hypothetical protein [Akkermansiaceae bacterium]
MSPTIPPPHPSQAVERIREIIVGRRLDHLENRLARVEAHANQSVTDPAAETRLVSAEAQLESLRDNVRKLAEQARDDAAQRDARHREEIQRIAALIQQSSSLRTEPVTPQATARLEQKISTFLSSWQASLQQHLAQRETLLTDNLNQELAKLRGWAEARIAASTAQTVTTPEMSGHFARIAAAAQSLADTIRLRSNHFPPTHR